MVRVICLGIVLWEFGFVLILLKVVLVSGFVFFVKWYNLLMILVIVFMGLWCCFIGVGLVCMGCLVIIKLY